MSKKFKLSDEEKVNGKTRMDIARNLEYQLHLVVTDMNNYVDLAIKKRLGLTPDQKPEIDWESGDVTVPDQVVVPNNAEIATLTRETNAGSSGKKGS